MAMTSNRPYLIRAFFDWIVDNDCTPYVVVNALADGVAVPQSHVNDDQIVLNIAPRAVTMFNLDHGGLSFNTRFGGVPTDISVPSAAIMGIYAQETGQGIEFPPEDILEPLPPSDPVPPTSGESGKRRLRVVK